MKPSQVKRLRAQVFQPCKSGAALYFEFIELGIGNASKQQIPIFSGGYNKDPDNMMASVLIRVLRGKVYGTPNPKHPVIFCSDPDQTKK